MFAILFIKDNKICAPVALYGSNINLKGFIMKKIPSIIENKTVYSFQQKYPNINQKPTIEIFSGLLRRQGNAIFLSENDRVVKYGKEYWLANEQVTTKLIVRNVFGLISMISFFTLAFMNLRKMSIKHDWVVTGLIICCIGSLVVSLVSI